MSKVSSPGADPVARTIPMSVEKISDGVYKIDDNTAYIMLFVGEKYAMIVDTGYGQAGSLRALVESLTDKPVILVNTHYDYDHIGNNEEFDVAHIHPAEMAFYYGLAKPEAKVKPLWDGDIIDLGGRKFEVVHIPGHTPGSIALLDRENRILVTGDSISETAVFLSGKERSFHAFIASMEKLMNMRDAFDEIYPAHGNFPLSPVIIEKLVAAAEKCLAGEITPVTPTLPVFIPPGAMEYTYNGATFIF